ncbi:MAG: hypothetical protein ACR2L2_11445 [Acidobacteriota bacterium]
MPYAAGRRRSTNRAATVRERRHTAYGIRLRLCRSHPRGGQ